MLRLIKYTQDFANRKKGDTWYAPSMLASELVKRGVAEYHAEKKAATRKKKAEKKKDADN